VSAAALLQFPCTFQLVPLRSTVPSNVHAHLSAFSFPCLSYQAFSCGSVRVSLSSWPLTFASDASCWPCPVTVSLGSQPASPASEKKKPTSTRIPLIVPPLCQAQ
jgi:hypothetical protein